MRLRRMIRVGIPIVGLWLLFCAPVPLTLAGMDMHSGLSDLLTETRPSVTAWVSRGANEALLSEGAMFLVCALAVLLAVAGVEALDLRRRRRAAEAARLHARIATAWRANRRLRNLVLTPIVRLPLWGQATIELCGRVPSEWLRRVVLRVAKQEAAQIAADFRIRNRIAVVPSKRPRVLWEASEIQSC